MTRIYPYLTYAGAIPFIICAICLATDIQKLPVIGSVESILAAYALVISTFLAGAHWGQHLQMDETPWTISLPIISNIITVLLWIGFLILSFKLLLLLFVIAFAVLLMIDYRLFEKDLITVHYFRTRLYVSAIVMASLIIAGIYV